MPFLYFNLRLVCCSKVFPNGWWFCIASLGASSDTSRDNFIAGLTRATDSTKMVLMFKLKYLYR